MGYSSSGDHNEHRKEGQGTRAGKRGLNPTSSVWSGGRPMGPEHTRRSSNKQGVGPARPSAEIPDSIYGDAPGSRGKQNKNI